MRKPRRRGCTSTRPSALRPTPAQGARLSSSRTAVHGHAACTRIDNERCGGQSSRDRTNSGVIVCAETGRRRRAHARPPPPVSFDSNPCEG
ncbi:hypothetical protein EVAR_6569_1 [Eumeta japonica]|uniref:Uncharacterized protein n=1 Tax=Eumeta variegata TaxID=151549 RepID=A0A4C1STK6_EUMVA|nr:hypothetical protein EVAR_6569_1 [Eumeta japonica]